MEGIGGWHQMGMTKTYEVPEKRRQFIQKYRAQPPDEAMRGRLVDTQTQGTPSNGQRNHGPWKETRVERAFRWLKETNDGNENEIEAEVV